MLLFIGGSVSTLICYSLILVCLPCGKPLWREVGLHALVSEHPADNRALYSSRGIQVQMPLWLYPENRGLLKSGPSARVPNLAPDFLAAMKDCLSGAPFSPEDIFAYIYAMLYSPAYRMRYADFLRRDYPHIPLTGSLPLFQKLAALGHELIDLHLLRRPLSAITGFPKTGSNRVDKFEFKSDPENPEQGRVQINAEQYFEAIPKSVWEYIIGGYPVAHKWLKDRKGRLLTFDELQHYGRVIAALNDTIRLQAEIDAAIGSWPLRG